MGRPFSFGMMMALSCAAFARAGEVTLTVTETGHIARATEAAPGLFAPPDVRTGNRDCDAKLDAWMRITRRVADPESPAGLFKARQTSCQSTVSYASDNTHWFGWMDFGDISVPVNGPVGLHYDWTWIVLANLLRTGHILQYANWRSNGWKQSASK